MRDSFSVSGEIRYRASVRPWPYRQTTGILGTRPIPPTILSGHSRKEVSRHLSGPNFGEELVDGLA